MSADGKARSEADELFRKGYECLNRFEFDRAIEYFNQALELNPDDANVLAGRGFALKTKGDVDKASADYGKALEINPNDGDVLCNRGFAHGEKH